MFHVKICGVTTADDARLAVEAGADAVGLNFVPGSPRHLDLVAASAVRAAVPKGAVVVGVFAGAAWEEIRRVAEAVGLDAIQLHGLLGDGTEDPLAGSAPVDPPELCRAVAPLPVIRAVRLEAAPPGGDPLVAARAWIEAASRLGHAPLMAIVDASVSRETNAGRLGGTGAVVDWEMLARARPLPVPTALAGGLTPDNVAAAIAGSGAGAVDTASGVEASPGRKDPARVRAFVARARAALGLS